MTTSFPAARNASVAVRVMAPLKLFASGWAWMIKTRIARITAVVLAGDPRNAPRFDHLTKWAARTHRASRSAPQIREHRREGRVDRRLRKMGERIGESFHGHPKRDCHYRSSIVAGGEKCLDIAISDLTAAESQQFGEVA